MAVLGRYDNIDAHGQVAEVVLTVDERVIGTISPTSNGHYHVRTKGLVPAIDSIAGASFNDAWSKVADRVRSGGVYLTWLITSVIHGERA